MTSPHHDHDHDHHHHHSSTVVTVTPQSLIRKPWKNLHHYCARRRETGSCSCYWAQRTQNCQCCHKNISLEDCIKRSGYGWVHTECPEDENRGLPSIKQGFSPVNLASIEDDPKSTNTTTSVKRRLKYDDDKPKYPPKKSPRVDDIDIYSNKDDSRKGGRNGKSEIESADGKDESGAGMDFLDEERGVKQDPQLDTNDTMEDGGHRKPKGDSKEDDREGIAPAKKEEERDKDGLTKEQRNIVQYQPKSEGEIVCVNALAGCGKTTTISLLCNRYSKEQPNWDMLYLVFNAKNKEEAMSSGKFPKKVEIKTTHSYILRHYFSKSRVEQVKKILKPTNNHDLEDIANEVSLKRDVSQVFTDLSEHKLESRVTAVARFIRKTIQKFEASADKVISEKHVPWKATNSFTKRSEWRTKLSHQKYVSWANEYFTLVHTRCRNVRDHLTPASIPHDSYFKVAQLEGLGVGDGVRPKHRVVMIDEAQDMTPCQASFFWGWLFQGQVVYLFGDRHQQLYRFRGASDSFRDMVMSNKTKSFDLRGSFRFGERIAKVASEVLKIVGGNELVGRAREPGMVHQDIRAFVKGAALCRSNNGMMKYLLFNSPKKWCFLDPRLKPLANTPKWVLDMEMFLTTKQMSDAKQASEAEVGGEIHNTFSYKRETFQSVEEIQAYGEDEEETELLRYISLLRLLVEKGTSFAAFQAQIKASFVPHDGSIEDYDGVIMATGHKGKGLEFDSVLVYDDFNFELISSFEINKPRCDDEVNALYVAVTRAKKRLYLSAAVVDCLAKRGCDLGELVKASTIRKSREEWEKQWTAFKDNKQPIHTIDDIPWPSSDNHGSRLLLDCEMTETEQFKHLRVIVLRYHPDKFLPKYHDRMLDDPLRQIVKAKLEDLQRSCLEESRKLRNNGDE